MRHIGHPGLKAQLKTLGHREHLVSIALQKDSRRRILTLIMAKKAKHADGFVERAV